MLTRSRRTEGCAPSPIDPSITGDIDTSLLALSKDKKSPAQRRAALDNVHSYLDRQKKSFIGFQTSMECDFSESHARFLDININNVGDPFSPGYLTVNTKAVERAVLDWFATLWNGVTPHDPRNPDSYWGYCLTMGSSEGNLYSLWSARDYLAGRALLDDKASVDAKAKKRNACGREGELKSRNVIKQAQAPSDNPNAYRPIAFFSEDTHYSIMKAMRALCIDTFHDVGEAEFPGQCPITADGAWPAEVPSKDGALGQGAIDVDALAALVEFFAERGFPILVSLNFGSTFKGAYDDVEKVCERLEPILKRTGLWEREVQYQEGRFDSRTGYWIHIDAALGGAYMPFVAMAAERGQGPMAGKRVPKFDFSLPMVHSTVVSGHKWVGAPWPCGVVMSKVKYQISPPNDPGYIGSPDTTFSGSRNGFSPLILWESIARMSYEDQIQKAIRTEELSLYAYERFKDLSDRLYDGELWVDRTPLSLTVRFRQPNAQLVYKYSLSSETLLVDGVERNYSHVFLLNHVDESLIDELVEALAQPGAFDIEPVETVVAPRVAAGARHSEPRRLVHALQGHPHHSHTHHGHPLHGVSKHAVTHHGHELYGHPHHTAQEEVVRGRNNSGEGQTRRAKKPAIQTKAVRRRATDRR